MESEGSKRLGLIRWIVILMYVSGLVACPILGQMLKVSAMSISAEALRLLPIVFGVVAVSEYVISLVIEKQILSNRSGLSEQRASAAAIVSAAFGASFAVYGLVLALLGASVWSPLFYLLSLIHGIHLSTRWSDFEQAAES